MLLGSAVALLHQQAAWTLAFPLVVPNATTVVLSGSNLTVPNDEAWIVSFAGGHFIPDDNRVTLVSVFMGISPNARVIGATSRIPIPTQQGSITLAGSLALFTSILLAGVELMPGESMDLTLIFANSDAVGNHNVLSGTAGIRYRPFKLVSEMAVAQLQAGRQDLLLDQRLKLTR